MELFPSLFHESGGVIYHWRAFLNQLLKKRWAPHLEHTLLFLQEWNPSTSTLYLIGPSGGYSLPKNWLHQFKTIIAFEPDAIARKIFELRTRVKPHWIKTHFNFDSVQNGSTTFTSGSAILFCNVLGQLHFDENAGLQAQEVLCQLANSHPLASYHDILSGDHFRFEWRSPMNGDQPVRVKYEIQALDPYFAANEGITELDLHVHPAAFLFQDEKFKYQYWEWQITATQTQVIEGAFSKNES